MDKAEKQEIRDKIEYKKLDLSYNQKLLMQNRSDQVAFTICFMAILFTIFQLDFLYITKIMLLIGFAIIGFFLLVIILKRWKKAQEDVDFDLKVIDCLYIKLLNDPKIREKINNESYPKKR